MLKICFITNNIAEIGGRQRINAVIANALANVPEVSISILFTSPKDIAYSFAYQLDSKVEIIWDKKISRGKKDDLSYKVFRSINKRFFEFKNVSFLKHIYFPNHEVKAYQKLFEERNFDVVIGVGTRPGAMLSLLNIKSKKVVWLHTSYDVYFRKKGYFQWKQERLYQALIPKLDEIVVLTDGDVELYSERFNINPVKIYNPLSFECQKKSKLEWNKILFIGRLDYELKGLDLLIEVMVYLKNSIDFTLTVVGDGPGRERFEKEIRKAGLQEQVAIMGFSNNVHPYYCEASVVVLPSRQEGFGLVVTEAMECGIPVVSFRTEGPSEIIRDGIDGYLIDKFDTKEFATKVNYLCSNKTARKKMGDQAALRARDFSLNNIINKWMQLFAK